MKSIIFYLNLQNLLIKFIKLIYQKFKIFKNNDYNLICL